ncbi:unnamed protein product [Prorocentrum cordatum]|uniref:Uncharacterized protein n=1 Tax=Prorocentrum cordatum TaxID=2364126 RepID=A0ABN9PN65_9DINO|nr:unnamed protein product [Polarella glacialis]CAK0791840.1 unnamed protein product [Polarella glacialis]
MARASVLALMAFPVLRAGALNSAAEAQAEETDALSHRAYLDVTVGAVSAGAQAAEVQELSAHGHRAYLDVTVGAVSAGAQAAEVQELRSGSGHRAYLDVTAGAVSHVASDEALEELDAGDRPKGARRRARERALAAQAAEDVAKSGCAQLGGDKWFSDAHGELFQVKQEKCSITFPLKTRAGTVEKRGVVRGTKVLVEPPFPEGTVVGASVKFENGAQWERKW